MVMQTLERVLRWTERVYIVLGASAIESRFLRLAWKHPTDLANQSAPLIPFYPRLSFAVRLRWLFYRCSSFFSLFPMFLLLLGEGRSSPSAASC